MQVNNFPLKAKSSFEFKTNSFQLTLFDSFCFLPTWLAHKVVSWNHICVWVFFDNTHTHTHTLQSGHYHVRKKEKERKQERWLQCCHRCELCWCFILELVKKLVTCNLKMGITRIGVLLKTILFSQNLKLFWAIYPSCENFDIINLSIIYNVSFQRCAPWTTNMKSNQL